MKMKNDQQHGGQEITDQDGDVHYDRVEDNNTGLTVEIKKSEAVIQEEESDHPYQAPTRGSQNDYIEKKMSKQLENSRQPQMDNMLTARNSLDSERQPIAGQLQTDRPGGHKKRFEGIDDKNFELDFSKTMTEPKAKAESIAEVTIQKQSEIIKRGKEEYRTVEELEEDEGHHNDIRSKIEGVGKSGNLSPLSQQLNATSDPKLLEQRRAHNATDSMRNSQVDMMRGFSSDEGQGGKDHVSLPNGSTAGRNAKQAGTVTSDPNTARQQSPATVKTPATNSTRTRKTMSLSQQLKKEFAKDVILLDGVRAKDAAADQRKLLMMKELDPSVREFQFPDFGFRDDLNNDGNMGSIWTLLFDHISCHPKFERLRNYIQREKAEKMEAIKKQLENEEKDEQAVAPMKGKKTSGGNLGESQSVIPEKLEFAQFETMLNNVLGSQAKEKEDDGKEKTAMQIAAEEQKKYDQYILEKLFLAQVEKNKSPEELEIIKQEKFANPITGKKGGKITSKAMRQVWVQFLKLTKEADQSETDFNKKQLDFKLDRVNDSIDELKLTLEHLQDDSQENLSAKHSAKLVRKTSRSKLQKLLLQRDRLQREQFKGNLKQGLLKQGFKNIKSSLDNQMNKRYLVNKNKNLQYVPNFVKLNANRNTHAVNISQEVLDQLSQNNTSLVNLSLVTRPKISTR